MSTYNLPEPLQNILRNYCHVELFWAGWHESILAALERNPEMASQFKQQLAEAIVQCEMTPQQLRALTNHEFKDEIAVGLWLTEIWREIYGDEPVPGED